MHSTNLPVLCQNSHTISCPGVFCSSGCFPVLADQALDGLPAFGPGGHIDGLTGLVQRRSLFPATVRSMFVVVLRVLSEDLPQMLFAIDQEVAGALAP